MISDEGVFWAGGQRDSIVNNDDLVIEASRLRFARSEDGKKLVVRISNGNCEPCEFKLCARRITPGR